MTWGQIITELRKSEYADLSNQDAAEALTEATGTFTDADSIDYARNQMAQQDARVARELPVTVLPPVLDDEDVPAQAEDED